MAEFLVFIRSGTKKQPGDGHWMDDTGEYLNQQLKVSLKSDVTEQKRQLQRDKLKRIQEGKAQVGDIIEVHEDGFWDKRGFDKMSFALVKAPGLDKRLIRVEPVMSPVIIVEPTIHDEEPHQYSNILRQFRYSVAGLNLKPGEIRVIEKQQEIIDLLTDKAELING